jgi:addiction module RelE/StbE family toxin
MAFQIIWTETAGEDLKEIVLFIAQDNREAAIKLAEKVFEHIERAAQLPLSNRIVPEKGDECIREAILNPYRIIYQFDETRKAILVLRIWHGFRGIPKIGF